MTVVTLPLGLRRSVLGALAGEERAPALLDSLRQEVSRSLRIPVARVDPELPLSAFGVDSLAAIELQHRLEEGLGVAVPLTELIEGVSLEALVPRLLAALDDTDDRSVEDPVPAPEEAGAFPLSHGQRALWFLHRLAPESSAYHVPVGLRVRPALDLEAFRRALAAVGERHGALRTTFHEVGGEPRQTVRPRLPPEIVECKAGDLGPEERERWIEREVSRPFDPAQGPLLRLAVLRCSASEDLVVLVVHHIVADFWSLAVLARELVALYLQETGTGGESLTPPSKGYAEYVELERARLRGREGRRLEEYWVRELGGTAPVLDLPCDRPRPPVQTYRGTVVRREIGPRLSAGLEALCRRLESTRHAALLAAFQALLHRYTGQGEVRIGSPVAGRDRPRFAGTVGYFAGPVVLRSEVSDRLAFQDLLAQVRRRTLVALDHSGYPFPLLVERLQGDADPSRSPLFQAAFVWHRPPPGSPPDLVPFALGERGGRLELGAWSAESLDLPESSSQFDLTLRAGEVGGRLRVSLQLNVDLFDPATGRRLLGHFHELLAGAVADPGRQLGSLPLLTPAERHQVVVECRGRPAPPVVAPTLHALVEAQAGRTPGAEAVVAGAERLTYGELEERAGRLARVLQSHGVGPETRVGVCLERGVEMVVSLLAVLKAGGAYVPLDPAYPPARRRLMLEDSGARLALARRAPDGAVAWIDPATAPTPVDPAPPPAPVGPGHLAYVIYTSGSTGRPKGVAIEHRSAVDLVHWAREELSELEISSVLASTSVCFDLSVFELFVPLACGGRVLVVDDALALRAHPAAAEVTLVNTVPSALAALVDGGLPAGLRVVNLAGEPLRRELVDAVHAAAPEARVWNLYGPSEDTTYSTAARVAARPSRVTIGRPLPGGRAYVADRRMNPLPLAVPGELLLGGSGLARGYLNRPARTAERFVPDPFGRHGERLYRTGDRVRLLPDGELDFQGRLDHQVKVRGFRIELGEVESVLLEEPAARDCVVVVRDLAVGPSLVAYVTADGGATDGLSSRLRSRLEARLPRFMVPSHVAVLESLPRLPNGKVDRERLPVPELEAGGAGEAPRTPVEDLLAGIFCDLLGIETVDVETSFFALGGHSLLAMQLASRVLDALGVELPVRAIFEAPSIAALADRVEAERGLRPPLPPVVPQPREGPLPLSFAQQRMWFLSQLEPESAAYNVPGAARLLGDLDYGSLAAALAGVVERHEALRTTFPSAAGIPVQAIGDPAPPALPVIDLAALPAGAVEAEANRRLIEQSRRPFDLARGPLLRAALLRVGLREHRLVVVLHHAVSDGWSLGILIRELGALYGAFRGRRASGLPELPVQYADFAAWQRSDAVGARLERELGYWRDELEGLPAVLDLPADRPRPKEPVTAGGRQPFRLSPPLSSALVALSRRSGTTLFMTLLAGFQTLLGSYSGRSDLAVGSPVAGRRRVLTEGLIGLFVNTVVLRATLRADRPFAELLVRTRETALSAYEHQDLPFERLVEELAPDRDASRNPLVQAMLVLQTAPRRPLALPGLEVERLEVPVGTAKLDLVVTLEETAGGLSGLAEYPRELFDATTVSRLLGHWEGLLEAVVEDPSRRLSTLPGLRRSERHQLVVEWADTDRPRPADACLDELVAWQAARTPDAEALVVGGERLTYGELEARADRLARRLRRHGVGPEVRVGVSLERSADLVVSLLAVLKAGGAYVPIDPTYPSARRRLMLEDSGARVVLARGPAPGPARVLDPDLPEDAAPEARPCPRSARPRNLAYVIYTSGSTGRPKGVAIEHRSAVELVCWALDAFPPEALSGVVASTSVSFDLSVFEIFVPLSRGGRVVLANDALAAPGLAEKEAATMINTVPSAMAALLPERWPRSLRAVNLAGEPLRARLVDQIYARTGVDGVWNLYGPSEDTTYSTFVRVPPRALRVPPDRVTVGRPVARSRAHVLDRRLAPPPLGVAGELCLSGAGLARGYLGRPADTAERFVPDSFGRCGDRLYRTGDLARWLSEAELDFLGRIDDQVKVRGHRIEPGEVETLLVRHPSVREAAVVARELTPGDPQLVAYVVAGEPAPAPEELSAHLRRELPAHAVPTHFTFLDVLPRTPSGKLDRRSLPEPERTRSQEYVAPRTAVEETVAGMFSEVLGMDRVSVEEDFFRLGGHSLLATQLLARVRECFQVELPLRRLFEHPTAAALAQAVVDREATPGRSEKIAGLVAQIRQMSGDELQTMVQRARGNP